MTKEEYAALQLAKTSRPATKEVTQIAPPTGKTPGTDTGYVQDEESGLTYTEDEFGNPIAVGGAEEDILNGINYTGSGTPAVRTEDRVRPTPAPAPAAPVTPPAPASQGSIRSALATGSEVGSGYRSFRGATSKKGRRGMADALRIGGGATTRASTRRTVGRKKQLNTLGLNIRPGIGLQI